MLRIHQTPKVIVCVVTVEMMIYYNMLLNINLIRYDKTLLIQYFAIEQLKGTEQ